jgi:hypothetical protein
LSRYNYTRITTPKTGINGDGPPKQSAQKHGNKMQINDEKFVEWIWWLLGAAGSLIMLLTGNIWREDRRKNADDRKRIDEIEVYIREHASTAVTRPEVHDIAQSVKREVLLEVKEDHRAIMETLAASDRRTDELRQDIRSLTGVVIDSLRKREQ